MSTIPSESERVPLAETLPRCAVCHRRLRSTPWKYLQIGPICAKKNPEITSELRKFYIEKRREQNAELDKREIDTLDAELRWAGVAS